jgi:Ca2+-binding RTX toxin-like protein
VIPRSPSRSCLYAVPRRREKDTLWYDVESLAGGKGNDKLTGNAWPNTINGGPGNDTIRGGDNFDVLIGDAGSDKIYGGDQDDWLIGGFWNWDTRTSSGSNSAKDRLDGGANSLGDGDVCYVQPAGTTVRCEIRG